jgi:DNA polymerase sigma
VLAGLGTTTYNTVQRSTTMAPQQGTGARPAGRPAKTASKGAKPSKNGKKQTSKPKTTLKQKKSKNKVKTSEMTRPNSSQGSNGGSSSAHAMKDSQGNFVPLKKSKKAKAKAKEKNKITSSSSNTGKSDVSADRQLKRENSFNKLPGDVEDDSGDEIIIVSEASDESENDNDSDDQNENERNSEQRNHDRDIVLLDSDDDNEGSASDGSEVIDISSDSGLDSQSDETTKYAVKKDTMNDDFIALDFSDDGEDNEMDIESISDSESGVDGSDNEYLSNDEGSYHSKNVKHKAGAINDEFPWIRNSDHSKEREMSDWLTSEMKDFVKYISPCVEEINTRNKLIENLRQHIRSIWPDAELHCFGSFATDLYLPGSDIDCVVISQRQRYDNKSSLYQLTSYIRNHNLGIEVTPIAKAKVPIIKFVDPKTKIHIDISFERQNGLIAAQLIIDWLKNTPGLRELVLIVKQFLAVRRLNEVHVGGLGGFSIICLCYSFLKLHPRLSTGNIDPMDNLGCLLIEFFELYGYNFGYDEVAIAFTSQKEPIYIRKRANPEMLGRNPFLLAIQDPHDSANNISRGSFNLRDIKRAFGGAFELLVNKCYELNSATYKERLGKSILGGIIKYKGKQRDFVDARGHVKNVAFHAASTGHEESEVMTGKKRSGVLPPLPSEKAGLDPDEFYMSDSFYSDDEADAKAFLKSQQSKKSSSKKSVVADDAKSIPKGPSKMKGKPANQPSQTELMAVPESDDGDDEEYTPVASVPVLDQADFDSDSDNNSNGKDKASSANKTPTSYPRSAFEKAKELRRQYWEQKGGQF